MRVAMSRATAASLFLILIFGCVSGLAEDGSTSGSTSPNVHSLASSVATATNAPGAQLTPSYIGSYCADGRFRRASAVPYWNTLQPQREVPPSIDRAPIEGVVDDDHSMPGHLVKRVHPQSRLGTVRDQIVTFVYGRQHVLVGPTHIE